MRLLDTVNAIMSLPWNKTTINDSIRKVMNVSNQIFNESHNHVGIDSCVELYKEATGYDDYGLFKETVLRLKHENGIISKISNDDSYNYYAVMLIMRALCKHEYYDITDYLGSLKDTNMYVSKAIIKAFTRINESCWLTKIDSIHYEYMMNHPDCTLFNSENSDDEDINACNDDYHITLRKFIDIAVSTKLRSKMNIRLTADDITWLSSDEYVDFMAGVIETNRITAGAVNMHRHDVIHMLTCKPCEYMEYTRVNDNDPLAFLFTGDDSMDLLIAKIRFINAMMNEAGIKRDSCRIVSQLRITPSLSNYLVRNNLMTNAKKPGLKPDSCIGTTRSNDADTCSHDSQETINKADMTDAIDVNSICIKAWNQLTAWIESNGEHDYIMQALISKYDDALNNEIITMKQADNNDDIIMSYNEYVSMVEKHHDDLFNDVFKQHEVCNKPIDANHDFLSTNSIRYVSMRSWSWSFYNPDGNVMNTINYCIRNGMDIDMVGLAMVCLLTEALNEIVSDNDEYKQLLYDRIMRMQVLITGVKALIQGYPLEFAVQSALIHVC